MALASDLHFEFHRDEAEWMPPLAEGCDVLVMVI